MQFHQVVSRSLLILFLGFAAPRCLAWGDGGHMAIALRAWDALSPAQRASAVDLLKQHKRYQQDLLGRMPATIPPGDRDRWLFAFAATWPDYVWQIRVTSPRDFHEFFHAGWHVVGEPVALDASIPLPSMPPHSVGPQPTTRELNALTVREALPYVTAQLGDPSLPAADRAVALCWVMHLTGDLHEPCHCATLFSHRFKAPDGDHVATQLPVLVPGAAHAGGLHQYWDSLFCTSTDWATLNAWERGILDDPALRPEAMPELREHPTSDQWIAESHALAVRDVYTAEVRAAVAAQDVDITKTFEPVRLTDDYVHKARDIGRRRGALAGLRLAGTLSHVRWDALPAFHP